MSTFTERLARLQAAVNEQMEDYVPGGFTLLPPGEYEAHVQASLGETKNDPQRLLVAWVFTVAEGEKQGRKITDRTIIEDNKVGLQICRGRIEDLGREWPEKIAYLENVLRDISADAPLVKIRVTHENSTGKDGKAYVNGRVRIIDVGSSTPEATPEADANVDTSTAAPENVEGDPVGDPVRDGLLTLCNSYQLDYVKDDMDAEAIITALTDNGASFRQEDLNAEELELLDNAAPDLVERPAAPEPPAPPKRTMAAKPAAKPAAPPKPAAKKEPPKRTARR